MKALTLTQPWATLVAIGAKRWETRSWPTNYRGPLAIHAAKGMPRWADDIVSCPPFYDVLHERFQGYERDNLPRGVVVAMCELVRCIRVEDHPWWECNDNEQDFGDYSPGRWCFELRNVQPLPEPVPVKGALGLWEWAA